MQPTVEVLPPENSPGAVVLLSGKKRKGWKPPVLDVLPPRRAGRKSKYATPEGQEIIQKAFERYRDLGGTRSLAKVADEFGLAYFVVRDWSSKFKWNDKIDLSKSPSTPPAISNSTLHDTLAEELLKFIQQVIPIAYLKLDEMKTKDPDTGKTILTKTASVENLTKLINIGERGMTVLEKDLNRQKTGKEIETIGTGPDGKGPAGGVIVHVNILGLTT